VRRPPRVVSVDRGGAGSIRGCGTVLTYNWKREAGCSSAVIPGSDPRPAEISNCHGLWRRNGRTVFGIRGAQRESPLPLSDRQVQTHAVRLEAGWLHAVIGLGSIAGLHEQGHQIAAYCARCDARRVLPLAETAAQGKGSLRLRLGVRCKDCGAVGRLQVRPPVPTRGPGGWIEPH